MIKEISTFNEKNVEGFSLVVWIKNGFSTFVEYHVTIYYLNISIINYFNPNCSENTIIYFKPLVNIKWSKNTVFPTVS